MYCRYVPTDNKWKRRARLLTRIPTKLSFPLHLCFPYEESTQASISHTPYNKATQIQTRVNIEHTETYQASASDKKKKKRPLSQEVSCTYASLVKNIPMLENASRVNTLVTSHPFIFLYCKKVFDNTAPHALCRGQAVQKILCTM